MNFTLHLKPLFTGWGYRDLSGSDSYDTKDDAWNPIGAIIGGVVGGIGLIALVITCSVCICVKNKGRPGRIVAPTTGGHMVIMSQSHQRSDGYGFQPMSQHPYVTGQHINSANQGVAPALESGTMAHPSYQGPSDGAYPADVGDNSTIQN